MRLQGASQPCQSTRARPRAHSGRKSSTIGRRAASIATTTSQEGVKVVLRGIRSTIGTARAGKAPATADLLMQMVALCPDSMIGRRERALLALGFAGAFRRTREALARLGVSVPGVPRLQPGP